MSLDFVVWIACPVALPEDLPQSEDWVDQSFPSIQESDLPASTSWTFNGENWLIRLAHFDGAPPPEVVNLVEEEVHGLSLVIEGNAESAEEFSFAVISSVVGECSSAILESPAGIFNLRE